VVYDCCGKKLQGNAIQSAGAPSAAAWFEFCSYLAQDVELVLRVVDEVEGTVSLRHGQAK
jgi:hypothetical protein